MLLSEDVYVSISRIHTVSILVMMDVALGALVIISKLFKQRVSILVMMDVALGVL